MSIAAKDAASILGVSERMIYDLAAPGGPIPCYRFGRRITFDESDIQEYKQSCRSAVINRAVRSSLSSTALSAAPASALESAFRKLGVQPKLTNTTAKNPRASTQPRMALVRRTA